MFTPDEQTKILAEYELFYNAKPANYIAKDDPRMPTLLDLTYQQVVSDNAYGSDSTITASTQYLLYLSTQMVVGVEQSGKEVISESADGFSQTYRSSATIGVDSGGIHKQLYDKLVGKKFIALVY